MVAATTVPTIEKNSSFLIDRFPFIYLLRADLEKPEKSHRRGVMLFLLITYILHLHAALCMARSRAVNVPAMLASSDWHAEVRQRAKHQEEPHATERRIVPQACLDLWHGQTRSVFEGRLTR